ncbi:MAG: hypothetical protein NTZ95_03855 [Candidatus Omnitrophica bacterium]|nr:hypothetical protein [Candidatus Omnitrophota bacterium]
MDKKLQSLIVLLFCAMIVSFLIGEAIVRSIGHFDRDGNFFVYSFHTYPYRMPLHSWNEMINKYLKSKNIRFIYDPSLGWIPRPKIKSKSGLYSYNSDAIRTDTIESVISKIPRQGVLRIAIFGDSFTHSDDVSFKETWGDLLEKNLKKAGVDAEVLNFGVPGYGMDQSLLRWEKTGYMYDPQIVIFGLQLENINRNVNLARPLCYPNSGIPLFKPRFILEQNVLKLINTPTPLPDKIIDIVSQFDTWEYSKYEGWYEKDKYQDHIFLNSKLISLCYSLINEKCFKKEVEYKEGSEVLSLAIIQKFKEEVESRGKTFYVVFLPKKPELKSKNIGFLEKMDKSIVIINPLSSFLKEAGKSSVKALILVHYSAKGNKIVADALTDFILKEKRCPQISP